MKPNDIKAIAESGNQVGAVLIRNGGWQGGERHIITVKQAWEDDENVWALCLFNQDGVAMKETFVEAENILAVTVRFQPLVPDTDTL